MSNQRNELNDGDVVVIADKLDERIRKDDETIHYGTLIKRDQSTAWVLLKDGNIWIGDVRSIFPQKEQDEQSVNLREESDSEDSVD
jgi:hypothetical protein